MTAPPWPLARRKRQPGRVACGHYVLRGERVYSRDGRRWACQDCALALAATEAQRHAQRDALAAALQALDAVAGEEETPLASGVANGSAACERQ